MVLVNARAKERLPIRPQYINIMIINLENVFRLLVTPVLMPLVPMAEHVSNRTADMGRFWTVMIRMEATMVRQRLMVRIQADWRMDSS